MEFGKSIMLPTDLPGYNEWWGKLDEKVIPPRFAGHTVGYGEWGVIDTWRRKKPEFWNVKKAYSPVRLLQTDGFDFTVGKYIGIPVYNRFDFTNLRELTMRVKINEKSDVFVFPEIPPHGEGSIPLLIREAPLNGKIHIEFTDSKGQLLDSYRLTGIRQPLIPVGNHQIVNIDLTENDNEYIIKCQHNLIIKVFRCGPGVI